MKTQREIVIELEAMYNLSRRDVCGLSVEHVGDHYRATLPDGAVTSWWQANAMATIIDSWSRPRKPAPSPHTRANEHEALGMCLGMLDRIAAGRNYEASEYHAMLAEAKRHYDREQQLIESDIFRNR